MELAVMRGTHGGLMGSTTSLQRTLLPTTGPTPALIHTNTWDQPQTTTLLLGPAATDHNPAMAVCLGAPPPPTTTCSSHHIVLGSPTVEIPKETIIANTDFTTTSLIAKRRLSSKKRRQQQQALSSPASSQSHSSPNHAPSTVTVATTTPSSSTCSLSSAQPIAIGHSPPIIAVPAPQYINMAQVTGTNRQILNTAQQVTPNVSYQLLQSKGSSHKGEQVCGISKPISSTAAVKEHTQSNNKALHDFKWSSAHVFIAHRIQQHQQQLKHQEQLKQQNGVTSLPSSSSQHYNTVTLLQHQAHVQQQQQLQQQQLQQQLQQQQLQQQQLQQQQQLALFQQMYGCVPTAAAASINPNTLISLPHADPSLGGAYHVPILAHSTTTQAPQIVGFHIPGVYHQNAVPVTFAPNDVYIPSHHYTATSVNGSGPWVAPVVSVIAAPTTGPLLHAASWVK